MSNKFLKEIDRGVIQVIWRLGVYAILLMPVWLSMSGAEEFLVFMSSMLSVALTFMYFMIDPAISFFKKKECPLCYEEVDERASVCMHCKREIGAKQARIN